MASVSYLLVVQLPDFPGQSVVPREPHPSALGRGVQGSSLNVGNDDDYERLEDSGDANVFD